jgi:EpsI family protein
MISYTNQPNDQPLLKPLSEFPLKLGQWTGTIARFDEQVYEVLGVDDSILVNYRSGYGKHVQLYIGYYQSQREGDIIHSPKNCMPGAGWKIIDTSLTELGISNKNGNPVSVLKLTLQNGPKKQTVLYWYHSRGRVITSEYFQKVYLVIDAIFRQRTDGSFIRLIAPIGPEGEEINLNHLKQLAQDLYPLLDDFIPV